MTISMSGFIPSGDDDGLTQLAEQLVAAWQDAVRKGRDAGGATEVVVVGVLRGASLKTYRDPSVKPPTIELRFAQLEAVTATGRADQITSLIRQLREERQQVMPIPGVDNDPQMPDLNNVAEPERPKRQRPKRGRPLRPVDDPPPDPEV